MRADRWREAFGIEQTEIDALATLQPRALYEIVTGAIAPYYDLSLAGRVRDARREWDQAAQEIIDDQIDGDTLAVIRTHAAERLAELEDEIDSINEQLQMATEGHFELPEVNIPAAEIDEKLVRQASLISSAWSWAKATRALIVRKTYGDAA